MTSTPRAILIVQPLKLGDVVLSTPLLDDLHRAFPDARLDFMVHARARDLLAADPRIARLVPYQAEFAADLRAMRAGGYDWIVDPYGTTGTTRLIMLSRVRVRVGFGVRWPRSLAYTHRLPRRGRPPEYVVQERRRLLSLVGVPTSDTPARLFVTAAERAAAADWLAHHQVDASAPPIAFNLSASRNAWAPSRWAELSRLVQHEARPVVLFAAPEDRWRAEAFRDAGGYGVVVPTRTMREYLATLSWCAGFVSIDTGPAHFANALGVPTVTMYPRGASQGWNPGLPTTVAVEAEPHVPCAACADPRTRRRTHPDHDCVRSLTAATVFDAVRAALRAGGHTASQSRERDAPPTPPAPR